jgi:hypothetical protein
MQASTALEVGELIDEATTLLLAISLDVPPTALLIGKLRTCANQTNDGNGAGMAQKLRDLSDRLEQRLLAP